MFEAIDIYCERTGPEFWSEPVNALTNALFLVAAWFSWRRARQLEATSPPVVLLVGLLYAIGIGSFLFHTFANGWSQLADVLPILLFQIAFLCTYMRVVMHIKWWVIGLFTIAFLSAIMVARQYPELFNQSLPYAPALVVTAILALYHKLTQRAESNILLAASGTFILALTFRTIDMQLCPCLPLGTHFLWHTFNAITLYLVMRGLLANMSDMPRIPSN